MIGIALRCVSARDRLGEFEPVHVGHLDVGQHHVEDLPERSAVSPSCALGATRTR